jgi:putative transposase
MALDQSALLEVLEALKAAEVDERVRQAATTIYQALIEAELSSVIGAVPHERTPLRVNHRNGHRARTLTTTRRSSTSRTSPCGGYGDYHSRGSGVADPQAAGRVVLPVAAGAAAPGRSGVVRGGDGGLPARGVHPQGRRSVRALGADTGISKSEVSRICADLDAEVAAFRDRSLIDQAYP